LIAFGVDIQVHDPFAEAGETEHEYGLVLSEMANLKPADAVVLAVAHDEYLAQGWSLMSRLLKPAGGVVLDVKSKLDRAGKPAAVDLWRL
jgi:UDP-N-acetyl-D-galactosamine dehydrogenase